MNELGHVAITVEITPDHMNQQHWFQFELDQSYLAGLISGCRGVLEKYPIKSKPDV
jgi:hypothetical protein